MALDEGMISTVHSLTAQEGFRTRLCFVPRRLADVVQGTAVFAIEFLRCCNGRPERLLLSLLRVRS
jgi:hypothetical protein